MTSQSPWARQPTLINPPSDDMKLREAFWRSSHVIAGSNWASSPNPISSSAISIFCRQLPLEIDFPFTTITTLDADLARILEPRAPRPDLRMDAVRTLRQAGVRVGVSCSPVVPGITDSP